MHGLVPEQRWRSDEAATVASGAGPVRGGDKHDGELARSSSGRPPNGMAQQLGGGGASGEGFGSLRDGVGLVRSN